VDNCGTKWLGKRFDSAFDAYSARAGRVQSNALGVAIASRRECISRRYEILDTMMFFKPLASEPPGIALFTATANARDGVQIACSPIKPQRIKGWLIKNDGVGAIGLDYC
jgi:hypothetical protein